MSQSQPWTFEEFWQFYVREHRRPATRWLHFLGTTAALGLLAVCVVMGWWMLLLAVPVVGYAMAWTSHFLIERNKPATFRYPLRSFICDFKMWSLMISGRMDAEVNRVLGGK